MKKATMLLAAAVLVSVMGTVAFADEVADGQAVYTAQKCSMCHSIGGKGGKLSALDGVGSKLKPEEIKKWITAPKEMKADSKMKAYPNLAAKDLDSLVAYLSSLKK
jgi:cytochrome c2